jgi:hypothetical protein
MDGDVMKSADLSSYKKNKNGINATSLLDNLFKRTLIVAAFAALHQPAYAGVKALTSEEMGAVTGQAGLTIDLDAEAKRAAQNLSDFQASSVPLAAATGNVGFAAVAATTGGLMGLASAAGYEEQMWSVDFVKDGDDTSQLLSLWGADGTPDNELAYEFINIGDHGEVEQSLSSGDMMIHSGKSVHGFGSIEGHSFSVDRSVFGARGISDSTEINETIKWGEWDVIFDIETKNLNLNVYIEAERDTILDYLGMTVNVKVHNSRGEDQYIVKDADGKEVASFAHFQADIGSREDTRTGGVYFNILDFSGDVDYANVTFGTGPSIGSVYITDFVIRADMDIYEH